MCLCVWPAIDSAPGGYRDLSPVSLDPVWPEGVPLRKNFHKKWTVAELLKKKVTPLMLFYGENLKVWCLYISLAIFPKEFTQKS